jgi:protein-tyrosine phosphatase
LDIKGYTVSLSVRIKNYYGSKHGLLRYVTYEIFRMLGAYRTFEKIDFTKVQRLVFVCHGNICRSPLAEAVARKLNIQSISFGLDTRGNDPADPRAIAWASKNSYDLSQHKTMRVDQYQPQMGDLLVGMEPKHIQALHRLFARAPVQITMAGLWLDTPIAYLHDPYNTNECYFNRCERLVVTATVKLKSNLRINN